ncbi:MAG: TRAM domain-containing protein [Myxococcota bacterium]
MKLTTDPALAQGGDAVARAPDGRVVFIKDAAPSETVEVEITQENKTFLRARVVEVLRPSAARTAPRCPHYGTCGGCTAQHVTAEAQRSSKDQAFLSALRKIARLDPAAIEILPSWSGAEYGYRGRARLAVTHGRLGYRARGSDRVIAVDICPVLSPALEAALASPVETKAAELELVELDGAVLQSGDPPRRIADAYGPLWISPDVFQQQNQAGNAALLSALAALLEAPPFAGTVLELFAGSGNLTRVLARRAAQVVASEGEGLAVELLRRLALPNVEVRAGNARLALEDARRFDAALVDPPRTGLPPDVLEALGQKDLQALVYVSCDPATFARDVGKLAASGLRLVQARLFDFYPQTPHAEVLGLLVR